MDEEKLKKFLNRYCKPNDEYSEYQFMKALDEVFETIEHPKKEETK